ncbi:MAG: hypothetical protein AB1898_17715 [Acidobacteriota bacterium]
MQTSSRNGFGTKLIFHRPVGPGLFEATVWVLGFYVPLFPRSTWLIRPQGFKEESVGGATSTTHYVEFLERRKTPFVRILAMYFWVAFALVAMWAPLIWSFVLLDRHKDLNKAWLGGVLVLVPLVWAVALWIGLDLRRDRLYKQALKEQELASGAHPGPIG